MRKVDPAITDQTEFGFKLDGKQYALEPFTLGVKEWPCENCIFFADVEYTGGVRNSLLCHVVASSLCDIHRYSDGKREQLVFREVKCT